MFTVVFTDLQPQIGKGEQDKYGQDFHGMLPLTNGSGYQNEFTSQENIANLQGRQGVLEWKVHLVFPGGIDNTKREKHAMRVAYFSQPSFSGRVVD